jgi:hypothetical protein
MQRNKGNKHMHIFQPDLERIIREGQPPENTKDLFVLEQKSIHLVFEYGYDCAFPTQGTHIGHGFTQEKMTLWNNCNVNLPIAMRMPEGNVQHARIKGELFFLTNNQIISLDKYKNNEYSFLRKRTRILFPSHQGVVYTHSRSPECITFSGDIYSIPHTINAWMYIGNPAVWRDKIEWSRKFFAHQPEDAPFILSKKINDSRPWLKGYYNHTRQEADRNKNCKSWLYFPPTIG